MGMPRAISDNRGLSERLWGYCIIFYAASER